MPLERALRIALDILQGPGIHSYARAWCTATKPENIMVDDGDRIKLIDFGIAGTRLGAKPHLCQLYRDAGHARLHRSGTGEGQARRPPRRHLLHGRDPLRDAHRQAAVHRPIALAAINDRLLNHPCRPASPIQRSPLSCRKIFTAPWSAAKESLRHGASLTTILSTRTRSAWKSGGARRNWHTASPIFPARSSIIPR